jgi:hypothetical protein
VGVVGLGDGVATIFTDGYEAYEASLDAAPAAAAAVPAAPSKGPSSTGLKRDAEREDRRRKAAAARELEAAEAEVARLDRVVADLRIVFGDPATYGDPQRVAEFGTQLKHAEREAALAIERWERLALAHEDQGQAEQVFSD